MQWDASAKNDANPTQVSDRMEQLFIISPLLDYLLDQIRNAKIFSKLN